MGTENFKNIFEKIKEIYKNIKIQRSAIMRLLKGAH